ncbi:DEAD/DEAH box helicase family protein, partial [Streptococcus pyogenes]|uniref:DEAD/DEAH box helicase family protein n=1 Tax=Streptococcus pyogenes TaxID=1314 RepID=UPI0021CCDB15
CVVRQEHGTDIDAACGQLRSNTMKGDRQKAVTAVNHVENLKHEPRSYQSEAIRYFHYTQASDIFKFRKPRQLMFNMATGSGKTDLMAGLILYLYKEKGYQNFLFTVNTNGVLSKTIDNLTSAQSTKFLFNS